MFKIAVVILVSVFWSHVAASEQPTALPEDVLMRAYVAILNEDAKTLLACFDVPAKELDLEVLKAFVELRISKQKLDRLSLKHLGGITHSLFFEQPFYEYIPLGTERLARSIISERGVDYSESISRISIDHKYKTGSGEEKSIKMDIFFSKVKSEWKIDYSHLAFTGHRNSWANHSLEDAQQQQQMLLIPQLRTEITRMNNLADQIESLKVTTLAHANLLSPATQPSKAMTQSAVRATTQPTKKR